MKQVPYPERIRQEFLEKNPGRRHLDALVVMVLVAQLILPTGLAAQTATIAVSSDHVVSSHDMKAALKAASAERARNLQEVQKLFRNDEFRRHLRAVANLEKIERAVPTLDDETLARLAAESRRIEDDLRAGKAWHWIVAAALLAIIVVALVSYCGKAENVSGSCL